MRRTAPALLLGALLLSACSSQDSTGPAPDAPVPAASADAAAGHGGHEVTHNELDVLFATDMVAHHLEGVEMAEVALERSTNPDVRALAEAIVSAQRSEVEQMNAWLVSWGVETQTESSTHSHGESAPPGMMSDAEMHELESSEGVTFDRLWLSRMVEHHQGALDMARVEVEDGQFPEAVALAEQIVATQAAEIEQMESLSAALA